MTKLALGTKMKEIAIEKPVTVHEWVLANLDKQTIKEVCEHGCQSGIVNDLIYYKDTAKFYDEFEEEIWNMLGYDADDFGMCEMEVIMSLRGAKEVGGLDQLKNLLSWYAVERVCFMIENGG